MKKFNWLIPASVALIPVSIVGCGNKHVDDGYKAIPESFLNISTTGLLQGFNSDHRTEKSVDGYDKLVIPKGVEEMLGNCFTPVLPDTLTSPNVIRKITFAKGCACKRFINAVGTKGSNFNGLPNLEEVVFPPLYTANLESKMFQQCEKLKILDFRYVKSQLTYSDWIGAGLSQSGKIILKGNHNLDFATALKGDLGAGWEIIQK